MQNFLKKVETSFKLATKGEEAIHNLIWYWGFSSYLICYFVINKLMKISGFAIFDVGVAILLIVYFSWHIYALKKCSPKKPKLSKEEKKQLKIKRNKGRGKRVMSKLLLQEPISKWDPVVITIAADLFCIAHFLNYVTR